MNTIIAFRNARSAHEFRATPIRLAQVVIVCAGVVFMSSGILTAADTVLAGHVPKVVQSLQPIGAVPANQKMRLALGLDTRNKQHLAILLEELYDPKSPNYHRYLTTEQFTDAFGPTVAEHQAVINFVMANGFEVVGTFPNRLVIDVTASAIDIERTFNLKMLLYQDPASSRIFRAPSKEPSVPGTIPIVDISGLDDYNQPRVNHAIAPFEPLPGPVPNGGSSSGGRWWGSDFRAIYVPGTSLTGAGQRVGIFGIDLLKTSDITAYEDSVGYQHVPVTSVFLDGWQENWAYYFAFQDEITADAELAISMAPGLSEVVVFRGNPTNFIANDILNAMLVHTPRLNQLSSSFSWGGGPNSTTDNIFMQMQAQGQTFFEASGDTFANWYTATTNHVNVDDPSSLTTPQDNPYITIVGGTVVSSTGSPPPGSWSSEVVWSGENGYGTSGGPSHYYAIPSWQQGIDMTANLGSTTFRNVPDVALVANNINVYVFGYTNYFAGTSAAAPLWAGFAALANQQAAQYGDPLIGFVNPVIYQAGKRSQTQFFHDITVGDNNVSGSGQFPAVPGYDLCTGWGTPISTNTINLLAPIPDAPPSGLIGWWKGDGNANNSAGPDNGIAENGTTYAQGEVGSAFSFPYPVNGQYPDVHIPNISGQFDVGIGGGFTIEGWISPADLLSRPIVEWNNGSTYGVHLWTSVQSQGSLYANIVDVSGNNHYFSTPSGIIVPNVLQHVALTYNKSSGVATIYLNGSLVTQTTLGSVYPQTGYDLYLGARLPNTSRWAGLLDEMSLYNRALTAAEIKNIYYTFDLGKTCSGCSCVNQPSGLISWWRAENDATDLFGHNNGTVEGAVSYVEGEVGSAFYLNGTGPCVFVPASSSLNVGTSPGFTIEGWIQPSDNNGRPIVEFDSSSAYGVHLWANWPSTGNLFANVMDTTGTSHTFWGGPAYIVYGLWHHVALTYDKSSGSAVLYLDGGQVGQSTIGNITPQTTYNLYLGERVVGGVTPWFGALDEFSIYNRALGASEIAAIYHALGNGKCRH